MLLTNVAVLSLPADTTLCDDLVSCSLELTHGIWHLHDVFAVNVAQDLVEYEAGRDDLPNVLTQVCFQLNDWFGDIAPMSGESTKQQRHAQSVTVISNLASKFGCQI